MHTQLQTCIYYFSLLTAHVIFLQTKCWP